jgi:hypothetical protein
MMNGPDPREQRQNSVQSDRYKNINDIFHALLTTDSAFKLKSDSMQCRDYSPNLRSTAYLSLDAGDDGLVLAGKLDE